MARALIVSRKTRETDITLTLDLDGDGPIRVETGIGFFDHMLTSLALHAGWSLVVDARGDLGVDCHHTAEDTGILLGRALSGILGDRQGIARFGDALIPMDEALAACAADVGGRPFLVFGAEFASDCVGALATQSVEEFFCAFAFNAGITLHLSLLAGKNDHHKIEALFKAAAYALAKALAPDGGGLRSAKGVLG